MWYHFTDSVLDIGWVEIDGKIYHLEDSGAMTTGWRKLADREDDWGEYWYYFNSSGKLIYDGELKISGETYIFDHSGRMLTGWVNESDYTSTGRDDLLQQRCQCPSLLPQRRTADERLEIYGIPG